MGRDPKKKPLSRAQVRFLDEHVPMFEAWAGAIGLKIQPWQKRVVEALMRKDVIMPDGKITDHGKKAWEKARDKITGREARLLIIDDIPRG